MLETWNAPLNMILTFLLVLYSSIAWKLYVSEVLQNVIIIINSYDNPFDSSKSNCTLKFHTPPGAWAFAAQVNSLAKLSLEQKPKFVLLVPWVHEDRGVVNRLD